MLGKKNLATIGAALFAGPLLLAGPAFAGINSDSPPMPYTAPDPVYTPHKDIASVDVKQPQDHVTLTGNKAAPGTVAHETK